MRCPCAKRNICHAKGRNSHAGTPWYRYNKATTIYKKGTFYYKYFKNRTKSANEMTGHFRKGRRTDCKKSCISYSKKHPIDDKIFLKNPRLFYVGCVTADPIIIFGGMKIFSMGQLNIARCGSCKQWARE